MPHKLISTFKNFSASVLKILNMDRCVVNSFKVVKNFGKPETVSSYITAHDDVHFYMIYRRYRSKRLTIFCKNVILCSRSVRCLITEQGLTYFNIERPNLYDQCPKQKNGMPMTEVTTTNATVYFHRNFPVL